MPEWLDLGTIIAAVIGAGTVGIIAFVAWHFGFARWTGKVDTRLDAVDSRMDKLDGSMDKVEKAIEKIRDQILSIFKVMPPSQFKVESPLSLTEHGEESAKAMGASDWAKKLAPTLRGELEGKEDFEVDMFCQTFVLNQLSPEMEARVRRRAYETGVDHTDTRKVLGVVLRDELLSYR